MNLRVASRIAEQLRKWGTFKAVSLSFYWFNDLWIWIRNSWIGTRNSWIWTCSFEFQLVVLSFQLVLLSIQRVIRNSQLVTRNSCFTISLVFHHTQKRKKITFKTCKQLLRMHLQSCELRQIYKKKSLLIFALLNTLSMRHTLFDE